MDLSPFVFALARYARIRRDAYQIVVDEVVRLGLAGPGLSLTGIDDSVLVVWRESWKGVHPTGDGQWDWESIARRFIRRPNAFHVAVWYDGRLCALAVGRMSKPRKDRVRHTVSVHYMEREPGSGGPLSGRVGVVVFAAAERYGKELGASRLRLMDPLPGLLRYYAGLGFALAPSPGKRVY